MSYDVCIADCDFNYTSNVSELFYNHMTGGLKSIDGMSGRQAANVLFGFWTSVNREYADLGVGHFRLKYDAQNGWGSTDGALIFMGKITAACAQYPRHTVRVSN